MSPGNFPGFKNVVYARRIPVCFDAPIADDFVCYGGKNIIPMVFGHGGGAPADEHTSIPMQFASHGYLVIMINYMEGHAAWTTDKDGNDIWFDSKYQFFKTPQRLPNGDPNPASLEIMNEQYD